jgi:hypothetical protein
MSRLNGVLEAIEEREHIEFFLPLNLKGRIFYHSWGYDQTNIDFVQVVDMSPSGKTAICRMMGKKDHSFGHVLPDSVHGQSFKLRVRESQYNGETEHRLVGSYPFCGNSTMRGYFSPWNGKPVFETPPGYGH